MFPYYEVKVVDDNGGARIMHFDFYVRERNLEITVRDSLLNRTMGLKEWRRRRSR
jgi:hypothetical protein